MTRALWIEAILVTLVAAAAVAAVPFAAGEWAWSWDGLNHHVYLGLIAESPRWRLDVEAASAQSYQYPYLYWPVYRLSQLDIGGVWAGALWSAALAALVVPPLWLTSRRLLQSAEQPAAQAIFERVAACVLALLSIVVLAALNTTANDVLAMVPLLWAVAITTVERPGNRRIAVAAALWGISVAFKLSHALAVPLVLVWWWYGPGWPLPWRRGALIAVSAAFGYVLVYAPWGWQLWRETGNPFHPFLHGLFAR
ncbi:MAG: hypothetical protein IPM15_21405 [Betaproteobacteria bacterium]|nr:hypothetical protein [Betaproteobacteria bacterium]